MKKISIITKSSGGPFFWGKNLEIALNKNQWYVEHIHNLKKILSSSIYDKNDLIHTSISLSFFKIQKKPLILTIHGDYNTEKTIGHYLFPKLLKKSCFITVPSKYLKKLLNIEDAIVIQNALFPDKYETAKHSDKKNINIITMTSFNFFDKSRGVIDLIKILNLIQKGTDKEINFYIMGNGKFLNIIKNESKKYKIKIFFLGFIKNPIEILKNGDIFLYYSYKDSFSISILEAMACGLPVITNEFGAANEIIKNGYDGFVVENHDEFIKRIHEIIKNLKLRKKMGKRAKEKIESKFNWNNIVKDYISLYEKVLE